MPVNSSMACGMLVGLGFSQFLWTYMSTAVPLEWLPFTLTDVTASQMGLDMVLAASFFKIECHVSTIQEMFVWKIGPDFKISWFVFGIT